MRKQTLGEKRTLEKFRDEEKSEKSRTRGGRKASLRWRETNHLSRQRGRSQEMEYRRERYRLVLLKLQRAHKWQNMESDSVGLGLGLRLFISYKLPGNVDATCPQTTLWIMRVQTISSSVTGSAAINEPGSNRERHCGRHLGWRDQVGQKKIKWVKYSSPQWQLLVGLCLERAVGKGNDSGERSRE